MEIVVIEIITMIIMVRTIVAIIVVMTIVVILLRPLLKVQSDASFDRSFDVQTLYASRLGD